MADSKLSDLTASAALTGAELVYVVQSGVQRRTTTGAISATAPAPATDLTYTAATRTLASSTGADVVLPLVTSTTAGMAPLSGGGSTNFLRADGTWAAPAGGGAGTDLTFDAATRTLASSTGADVVLPVATTTDAGLESAADKTKLDSITVDSATLVRKFVRNSSGVSIPKGSAVYQTGSSGTTLTVALADASAEATAAQTLGLAQETIANNATGYVVAVGLLDGIATSALTEGQIVWLSETAGALTTTRPTQPAHGVVCGYCVKQGAGTSGILYVKVDNGLELNELHDVLITSPAAGQVLRRASDGLWKNAVLAAADISGLGTAATTATTDYAPAAQGVTNGNSHDHNGGDGAQIAYSSLSGLPTLPTGTNTGDQALSNTSNATSHTVTLSGSGGSLQLVEGGNVSLTTSGTGSAGVVTISASGGGTSNQQYAAGFWLAPLQGAVASAAAMVANVIYLHPFVLARSITVGELGARVNTVAAGSSIQLAIYATLDGEPNGAPLSSTASLSSATAAVVSDNVADFNLTGSVTYWMATTSDGAPVLQHVTGATINIPAAVLGAPTLAQVSSGNTASGGWRSVSQTFGTWPTLAAGGTTVQTGTARGGIVYLQVAALL